MTKCDKISINGKLKTSDCMKVFNNDWDHLLADEF